MEEDAEIGNSYYVIIIIVNEFPSPDFPFQEWHPVNFYYMLFSSKYKDFDVC